jgi:hypothetical protein
MEELIKSIRPSERKIICNLEGFTTRYFETKTELIDFLEKNFDPKKNQFCSIRHFYSNNIINGVRYKSMKEEKNE